MEMFDNETIALHSLADLRHTTVFIFRCESIDTIVYYYCRRVRQPLRYSLLHYSAR